MNSKIISHFIHFYLSARWCKYATGKVQPAAAMVMKLLRYCNLEKQTNKRKMQQKRQTPFFTRWLPANGIFFNN